MRLIDDPQGRIETALTSLFSEGAPTFWEAQAGLATVLSLVAAAQPRHDAPHRLDDMPCEPTLAQHVDGELKRDLAAHHTLASLAHQLGLAPSTLSHRYAAETGGTPLIRLAHLRIELVQALLVAGTPLMAAAHAAGFCDQFHCSRVFRRITGASPSDFLRRRASPPAGAPDPGRRRRPGGTGG